MSFPLLQNALGLTALASLILNALAVWRGWCFTRLDLPSFSPHAARPPLSLLVPVCGVEGEGLPHFQRFCELDWPTYQLIFTVLDPADPSLPILHQLRPPPHVTLCVHIGGAAIGANLKIRNLQNAQSKVQHDWMIVCDADVEPTPNFLDGLMHPFAPFHTESPVGLVHSMYRSYGENSPASAWESVWINCDFWVQGLLGDWMRGTDFAFGAAMAFQRKTLEDIGGWAAFRDHLADDYELGHRIAATGKMIKFNPTFVSMTSHPQTWRQTWQHLLRWSRTIRVCQPGGYAGSIVLNMTLFAILILALDLSLWPWSMAIVGLRVLFANQCRNWILHTHGLWARAWLIPFKDVAQILLWILAFQNGSVEWRGVRYSLRSNGTLQRIE